ncbi:MAG: hypothetical protein HQK79_14225 [Desulfobacterales bacterium]|nr:hypothetical protein [Desulfobacterales bacterium]
MKTKLLEYLKQPSTWRGLIGIIAVFQASISPDSIDKIAIAAATLISLIEVIRDENKTKD